MYQRIVRPQPFAQCELPLTRALAFLDAATTRQPRYADPRLSIPPHALACCTRSPHNARVSYRVGIINVTGFAGMEAARLLWKHPAARITSITGRSLAGQRLGDAFPHLAVYGDMKIDAEIAGDVDIVMSALPTAASAEACAPFVDAGIPVIDIAADFRLTDPAEFEAWMGKPHPAPELLPRAVYGLPELKRDAIQAAKLVANPGCYPATSILALAPAVAAGLVDGPIVVDAKSGISGAGRGSGGGFGYSEVNEDVSAYKIANHNHQPEIAQELGALRDGVRPPVTFVPHLVPMTRGIHATCYAPLARPVSTAEVREIYRDFYNDAPFTEVVATPPHTKHTLGNNMCLVHPVVDERNGMLVAVGVLDNLVKGAAGQAIENMNLMLGLPQAAGLDLPAVYP
ncbi:MAG: N-acetyl-gamma-glutamyl-phosphate reductase [Dehalococcoidia bacterium]|nr:N-acetyl-gamma-glutamyl-phosphate reductase [Dehalococcoidia bacterium]